MEVDRTLNATCAICGEKYHVCNSCSEQRNFKPWRTVTDSINHYKVYMAIHAYTLTGNKEVAKSDLDNCDLTESNIFLPEIRCVIRDILAEDKPKVKKSKVTVSKEICNEDENSE